VALISFDNALADRKTHSGSRNRLSVKAFKDPEHLSVILRSDAYAIVGHTETPGIVNLIGQDKDARRFLSTIFDCVSD
jgi:hypothetical protein